MPTTAGWIALALSLSLPSPAHAGAGAWTTGGPYGGDVASLAVSPSSPVVLYAGSTHSGLFRSTDDGGTWVGTSLKAGGASVLAVDPSASSTLYGAGYVAGSSGLVKSTDQGDSWTLASAGLPAPAPAVYAVVIDPVAHSTLYVGTDVGVFKSTDAGGSWNDVSAGMPFPRTRALALDPTTSTTLYAGTFDGVYRSTDAGGSWSPANVGLWSEIATLAVDPATPATLYGATLYDGAPTMHKSTDSGGSWTRADVGLTARPVQVVIDPSHTSTLYAATWKGAFKSTDAGSSWSPAGPGAAPVQVSAIGVDASAPARLFAATRNGVFKSTDAGGSWVARNTGLNLITIGSLVIDPLAPSTLYAGSSNDGSFKSTTGGGAWAPLFKDSLPFGASFLAVAPTVPASVYAYSHYDHLYRSTDGGASWTPADAGLPSWFGGLLPVHALVVDSLVPTTAYLLAETPVHYVSIYKTTDAGDSWLPAGTNLPEGDDITAIVLDPTTPTTLYAGASADGIHKSTDGGTSWVPCSMGLPVPAAISSLAVDPVTPTTLLAGVASFSQAPGGVYRSTDAGGSWSPVNTGRAGPHFGPALAAQPATPATFFAVDLWNPRPAHRSTNSGGTWAPVHGWPPDVEEMALDPTGATLYVATPRGVWQTSPPPSGLVKGDMNGDGRPDLLFRSTVDGSQNRAWLMNGVAQSSESPITPDAASADWLIRGVDDFDDDGANDLLFWNQGTGQVEFWLMKETERTRSPVPLTGGETLDPSWELAATADLNRDGRADLVWRNTVSQGIVVWTMDGTHKVGELVPSPAQAVDGNWSIVAARDSNDDGYADLLWYNSTSGKIVTWYMDASVVRTSGQFTSPANAGDANWKVVASGDYSREYVPGTPPLGSPDIVWRNETSGNQVVWHMDFASTRVHGEFTSPVANTPALDWTIVGPR